MTKIYIKILFQTEESFSIAMDGTHTKVTIVIEKNYFGC